MAMNLNQAVDAQESQNRQMDGCGWAGGGEVGGMGRRNPQAWDPRQGPGAGLTNRS